MSNCTIYKNIYSDEPFIYKIDKALARIKDGASRQKVEEIRASLDKEKQDALKRQLPSVCFSGTFGKRVDKEIIKHSGFIVLDFDNLDSVEEKAAELSKLPYLYAMWLSPRANGLKCLIRVADGQKHREHFAALRELLPDVDPSGVNESRVCYESYDPKIYINTSAEVFKKTTVHEKYEAKQAIEDEKIVFQNLLKWQANKGGAFRSGERNIFIFRLAGACCRYGLSESSASNFILSEYPSTNDFTTREAENTIKSAYKSNASLAGSARFEREVLVDKTTRKEININVEDIDLDAPARDIIYGEIVKDNALSLFNNGFAKISGIGVPAIDERWKAKKGELTALTGIGNYGKSTFYRWYKMMRVLLYGEKFVSFSPEDNPPEEYYHDLTEMLLGMNCTPFMFDGSPNLNRPNVVTYSNAYDFVCRHFFYLYPKDDVATLDYVLERFLEMIIKEKVSGCCIDPWNQVVHDYKGFGANASKYLEYALGRISRFGQTNDVYMDLIVHPKIMAKNGTGNYDCPDVFDINDGAMWNNKSDNILVYHKPFAQSDRGNPNCEFHSKKVKRQKTVGKPGTTDLVYRVLKRRFEVDGVDPMQELINLNKLDFHAPVVDYKPMPIPDKTPPNPQAGIAKGFVIPQGYHPLSETRVPDTDKEPWEI